MAEQVSASFSPNATQYLSFAPVSSTAEFRGQVELPARTLIMRDWESTGAEV